MLTRILKSLLLIFSAVVYITWQLPVFLHYLVTGNDYWEAYDNSKFSRWVDYTMDRLLNKLL